MWLVSSLLQGTWFYIYVIIGRASQLCQKCQCIEIATFHKSSDETCIKKVFFAPGQNFWSKWESERDRQEREEPCACNSHSNGSPLRKTHVESGSLAVQVPHWNTPISYLHSHLQNVVALSCEIRKVLKFYWTAKLFPTFRMGEFP